MLTRIESTFTYRSFFGKNQVYQFTIVVNQNGTFGIRNIQGPYGLIVDAQTQVPAPVWDEMQAALGQIKNILAQTSAINGTLTFNAETTQSVTFAIPMVNTTYRVHLEVPVFIGAVVSNKTTTGFDVVTGITYTGDILYDVYV